MTTVIRVCVGPVTLWLYPTVGRVRPEMIGPTHDRLLLCAPLVALHLLLDLLAHLRVRIQHLCNRLLLEILQRGGGSDRSDHTIMSLGTGSGGAGRRTVICDSSASRSLIVCAIPASAATSALRPSENCGAMHTGAVHRSCGRWAGNSQARLAPRRPP